MAGDPGGSPVSCASLRQLGWPLRRRGTPTGDEACCWRMGLVPESRRVRVERVCREAEVCLGCALAMGGWKGECPYCNGVKAKV